MKKCLIVLAGLFFASSAWAQQHARKYIHEGNKAYDQKKYPNAEVDYRQARDVAKNTVVPDFNLGTALYKQKKYDKAAENFLSVAEKSNRNKEKADAFYNLGNTLLQAKKIDENIVAYKNALKYNPGDMDAKYNLLYAMKLKKQQQQQQKKNKQGKNQNQQNKNKQNKQNQQNKQNKEQQKQQQQNQQKQAQNQQQQKKNPQQQQPQPGKISKQDAERLLQALANDEKKVQAKVKKAKAQQKRVKSAINW